VQVVEDPRQVLAPVTAPYDEARALGATDALTHARVKRPPQRFRIVFQLEHVLDRLGRHMRLGRRNRCADLDLANPVALARGTRAARTRATSPSSSVDREGRRR
jgi:hypothetical protein